MLYNLFEKLFAKNETQKSIILFCFLIGMIALMRYFDAPLKNEIAPAGIVSYELAKNIEKATSILNSWNAEAMISAKKSLYYDFLFLCIYSTFMNVLIFKIARKLRGKRYFLSEKIMSAVFLAAFFDVIENLALLQLIYGNLKQIWSSVAYYFAVFKFGLLAIAVVYVLAGSCIFLFRKKIKV